ncbi:MAG TPA: hypothetical protein PKA88_19605, partial [Polyangiaceae bacterium]|nr:hypothetical protein [Polyangiaceae bacterium]
PSTQRREHQREPIPGEAGSDTSITQWRDWAANACKQCPTSPVLCSQLTGTSSTFDPVTKLLTLVVAPGVAEVLSGTVSFDWDALASDGGLINGSVTNAPLTVDKNALSIDLKGKVPDGVFSLYSMSVDLTDACGTVTSENSFKQSGVDAGTLNIYCES